MPDLPPIEVPPAWLAGCLLWALVWLWGEPWALVVIVAVAVLWLG